MQAQALLNPWIGGPGTKGWPHQAAPVRRSDIAAKGWNVLRGDLPLPLAVILIVAMCMLCALAGVKLTGGDNNTFVQVGLVVLMGLACKNAILIVEFARELELQGKEIVEAALEACRLRLRPIVMTSVAFIAGTVPLVLSHGAGAEVRSATGITVFAGMIGVTLFGLFLTPVFYVGLRMLSGRKLVRHDESLGHESLEGASRQVDSPP